jgi:hypothetical protein
MAVANSRDLSETRSVSGLQYNFLQLRRRMEGIPSQGVAAKHIIANEILYRSNRGTGRSYSVCAPELRCDRAGAGAGDYDYWAKYVYRGEQC